DQFHSRERLLSTHLSNWLQRSLAFFCFFMTQISLWTTQRFLQVAKTHVMKSLRISSIPGAIIIIILRTDYTEFRRLFSPTINNIMTRLTALFLDYLPTSIQSLSPWDWRFPYIVALVTRRLHIFQWQHRTAPPHLLFIKSAKASF